MLAEGPHRTHIPLLHQRPDDALLTQALADSFHKPAYQRGGDPSPSILGMDHESMQQSMRAHGPFKLAIPKAGHAGPN